MNVLMDHIHVIAMPYVVTLMGVSTVPVTMAILGMDSTAVSFTYIHTLTCRGTDIDIQ